MLVFADVVHMLLIAFRWTSRRTVQLAKASLVGEEASLQEKNFMDGRLRAAGYLIVYSFSTLTKHLKEIVKLWFY